jgi:hypothetical protein
LEGNNPRIRLISDLIVNAKLNIGFLNILTLSICFWKPWPEIKNSMVAEHAHFETFLLFQMACRKDFIWDMQNSAKMFLNNEHLHGLSMLCIVK